MFSQKPTYEIQINKIQPTNILETFKKTIQITQIWHFRFPMINESQVLLIRLRYLISDKFAFPPNQFKNEVIVTRFYMKAFEMLQHSSHERKYSLLLNVGVLSVCIGEIPGFLKH